MKVLLLSLVLFAASTNLLAADLAKPAAARLEEFPNKDTPEAAIYRGSIVFNSYCVLCHGVKADGNGRAAKLYNPKPANLVMSDKNDAYKTLIIRRGGGALARSQYMPPWGDELTDEQVSDVVAFLRSIQANKP
jgi:mono/diheme cytochrome c family protein